MSTFTTPKGAATRAIQVLAMLTAFGVVLGVNRINRSPDDGIGRITAIGFLLLAGTLTSELFEMVKLPHLSGYLVAGIISGPHVLHLLDHQTVTKVAPINTLALSLIALAGGAELQFGTLRRVARSLVISTVLQSGIVLLGMAGLFLLLARYVPFASELPTRALLGVALLWGVMSVTRSPSACLGILSQTRAKGPLATFSLAFIMLSDIVVVVLLAAALMAAKPLINGEGDVSVADLGALGHELLGSVAVGTTLGLALILYLAFVERQLLLVLIALGFGATEALRYIHIDPLLTFMVMGFIVENLSPYGSKLAHEIAKVGSIVYVVFFAIAGADLDVPLLRRLWPVAIAMCLARGLLTFAAARLSSRLAKDEPVVRSWGWSSLVSQAGLTIGLAVVVERTFPSFGASFRSLVIAAVAVNEMIGPVLFKLALDTVGESNTAPAPTRPSLAPPPPLA
jgi:Kef-type K+ transport system membrane component KefB